MSLHNALIQPYNVCLALPSYLDPINSNIATTCHKLQGKTLDNLIINSWNYGMQNWVYVVLSIVRTLGGIVLNKRLDNRKIFRCDPRLVRWEKMINSIEKKTFSDRDQLESYMENEKRYSPENIVRVILIKFKHKVRHNSVFNILKCRYIDIVGYLLF